MTTSIYKIIKLITVISIILLAIELCPVLTVAANTDSSANPVLPKPSNSIVKISSNKSGKGPFFYIRNDLKNSMEKAIKEINDKGGILPVGSGLRDLNASVVTGSSVSSLHYLGRAVDLDLSSGLKRMDLLHQ